MRRVFHQIWSFLSLVLLIVAPSPAAAAEFDSKDVLRLTSGNFDSFIANSEVHTSCFVTARNGIRDGSNHEMAERSARMKATEVHVAPANQSEDLSCGLSSGQQPLFRFNSES